MKNLVAVFLMVIFTFSCGYDDSNVVASLEQSAVQDSIRNVQTNILVEELKELRNDVNNGVISLNDSSTLVIKSKIENKVARRYQEFNFLNKEAFERARNGENVNRSETLPLTVVRMFTFNVDENNPDFSPYLLETYAVVDHPNYALTYLDEYSEHGLLLREEGYWNIVNDHDEIHLEVFATSIISLDATADNDTYVEIQLTDSNRAELLEVTIIRDHVAIGNANYTLFPIWRKDEVRLGQI